MKKLREVTELIEPIYVMEGAGVLLRRSIAGPRLDYLDPFLLFDPRQDQPTSPGLSGEERSRNSKVRTPPL